MRERGCNALRQPHPERMRPPFDTKGGDIMGGTSDHANIGAHYPGPCLPRGRTSHLPPRGASVEALET